MAEAKTATDQPIITCETSPDFFLSNYVSFDDLKLVFSMALLMHASTPKEMVALDHMAEFIDAISAQMRHNERG